MVFCDCSVNAGQAGLNNELEKLMSDPAFQQEMERMNKMIESDPALQAEVNKLLDDPEFQQAMNQMFEDPAFQEELARELQRMPEPSAPVAPVQPYQPTPSKPAEQVKREEPKKPIRDMTPTIDEINVRLENFIQKMAQYPDMISNFEKWTKKRRIEFGGGLTWDAFKDKVEKLKKILYEIKALDVKTQKPKYLTDLSANEGLCNNLEKFRSDLARHEPGIVVKLGKKVTAESKRAIVEVINDCLSAISVLKIQDELEKIIVKYDPIAKKLKEEEEKNEKMAIAAAQRRPAQPAPVRVSMGGRPEAQGYYQEGGEHGRPSYGPSPYYPGGYPGKSSGEPYKPSKPETGAAGVGKKPEEKKKDEPKKAEAPKKEEEKRSPSEDTLEKLYNEVTDELNVCNDLINENLANVSDAQCKDEHKCGRFKTELEDLIRKMKSLSSKMRSQVVHHIPNLSDSAKSYWITQFTELWKDSASVFDKFKTRIDFKPQGGQPVNEGLLELKQAYDNAHSSLKQRFSQDYLKTKPKGWRKPRALTPKK